MLLNNYKGRKEEWVIPLLLSRQFILIKDSQPLINILFQLIRCSNQPRGLLAYSYSVLNVNYKYSNSTFCPIVIDSPNQQDQGEGNYKKMLNLIFNERPKGSQVILGTVNRPEIEFEGKEIVFKDKYNLLSREKFEMIFNKSKIYFDKINLL
ncbi:hypothetical protein [Priestia flexa]|uniref:hypothetical protein n=1 Tax=Priestia flexa TaxID=86664 RepID=UPI000955B87A|nr:hypothetical protein [Priestia flexa]SIR52412.1 hypothetical protein SAMN05880580_1305 [Priestia flexa]